ncbi:MAG TPA: polysaccharide biosynthesis tyrosine autokinase [Solirubrobacterales bacterium]
MNAQQPLDFSTFVAVVRRRAKLIAGIAAAAALLAFGVSSLMPDRYDASSNVLFGPPESPPQIDPNAPLPDISSEPERVAATNLALASLDVVALRVQERIDSPKSAKELRESVTIEPQGQADLAKITAEGATPREAARIANAFAAEIVALRREKAQDQIQEVIDAIEGELAAQSTALGSELETRAEQLKIQKQLEAGDAEVVELATPPASPSSPTPLRNAIIGGVLGLILGVVVALLLRRLDRRVSDEDEVVEIVDAPVIGRIPGITDKGWKHHLAVESFQLLRANLQLASSTAEARTFAITSALPEEGKSTVALRLAHAFGLSGASVILVDCDLRRPTLDTSLDVNGDAGVTTALSADAGARGLLQDTSMEGVRLLPAGPLTMMPGSLVTGGDHDFAKLLRELAALADYVLVDTSPVTIGADASIIASKVDGTLLTVDMASVDRKVLVAAVGQLRNAEANIVGAVMNHADELLSDRSYQGYYGGVADRITTAAPVAKRQGSPSSDSVQNASAGTSTPQARNGHANGVRDSVSL